MTEPSIFRPVYRKLTEHETNLCEEIKTQAEILFGLFKKAKPGRYTSLGVTALEQSIMWVVKGITQ